MLKLLRVPLASPGGMNVLGPHWQNVLHQDLFYFLQAFFTEILFSKFQIIQAKLEVPWQSKISSDPLYFFNSFSPHYHAPILPTFFLGFLL